MNKKGYTLIEIIVCVSIISVVALASVIIFKNNSTEEKTNNKIKTNILAAADVYFSSNKDIQKQLADNYGFYILSVDSLKENGLLNDKQSLPTNPGDYTKMVINSLSSSNDNNEDIGYVNYIYPYEENDPFITSLEKLTIEYEEAYNFKCNSDSGEDITSIDYLDENYKKSSTDNFECGKVINDENVTYKNKSELISLDKDENKLTTNTIEYRINNNDNIYDRIIYVNPKPNFELIAKISMSSDLYKCGEWTNQTIELSINEKDETIRHNKINYTWYVDDTKINESNSNSNSYIVENTGAYKVKYDLYGWLSNEKVLGAENSCQINIDKNVPTIKIQELSNDSYKFIFKDTGGSGLDKYIISDNVDDTNWLEFGTENNINKTYNRKKENYTIYVKVKDKAGNITENNFEIIGENYFPTIKVEPIKNSFSKFKVTVTDNTNKGIDDIKMQYNLDENKYKYYKEDYYNSLNSTRKNYLTTFKNSFPLEEEKKYDASKPNYVNLNTKKCNSDNTECSFEVDMKDFINYCKNNYYCKVAIDYEALYNLSLNYHIRVTAGNLNVEKTINSVLNIYEKENEMNWFDYEHYTSNLIGTNTNGDILFKETDRDYSTIYYYNNANSTTKELLGYSRGTGVSYDYFSNNFVLLSLCSIFKSGGNYRENWQYYNYNIFHKSLQTEKISSWGSRCNVDSNIRNVYVSKKYYDLENYNFLENYLSILKPWQKETVTNPNAHSISNELGNYVFYKNINGVTWNSILTKVSYKTGGSYRTDRGKLYFLPEVSVSVK